MKEYKDLTNDEDSSFTAGPIREDDFFEWEALITGPEGTPFVSNRSQPRRFITHLRLLWDVGGRHLCCQVDIRGFILSRTHNQADTETFPVQPQDYPLNPFKMTFDPPLFHPNSKSSLHTIPCRSNYHPTVYPSGEVCISILHTPGDDPLQYESASERWSPVQGVRSVLMSVLSMLAEPNIESGANIEVSDGKPWENQSFADYGVDSAVRCLGMITMGMRRS
jgi:ubiquitin-conjugating enzyme E2 G2